MKTTFLFGLALSLTAGSRADLLPDLVPLSLEVPQTISAPPNPQVDISYTIANQGAGEATQYWNDILYFSTRPYLDNTALFLTYQSGPSVLEPGDTYSRSLRVSLPVVTAGSYYLILKANSYNYLLESNPNNNVQVSSFTFDPTPADLAPVSLVVTSNVVGPPNPLVTLAWGVTNLGPGYAAGYWTDLLFLSSKPTFDNTAAQIAYQSESGPVPAGGRYWRTNTVRIPVVTNGTYYLFFKTDQDNTLYETQTNNNLLMAEVAFDIQPPDLAPLTLVMPNSLTSPPVPSVTVAWGVTNQGTGPAIGYYNWRDSLYFSTDTNLDSTDVLLSYSYETGPIWPGESYWRTNTCSLPIVESGTYYLIFQTDLPGNGSLYESDTNNNVLVVPLTATIRKPDLLPLSNLPLEINGPPFPVVTLVTGGNNQGEGAALGWWYDTVLFATNSSAALQGAPFTFGHSEWLEPGGAYWLTNTVRLPAVADGTYYFTVKADAYANLYESDRSNNTVTFPVNVHILPPDLAPLALQVPNVITSPPNPDVTFIWGITNQGIGPAVGNPYWYDTIYLSTNPVWDYSATPLNTSYVSGPVDAGDAYWTTNTLRVPVQQSGVYYVFLKADSGNALYESDEQNNSLRMAINFVIQPPDLMPLISQIPSTFTGPPNPRVPLVWGVTNQGPGLAKGYWSGWYDSVYFSTDPYLDSSDATLNGYLDGGPVAAGASYWHTNSPLVPVTQNGTYYLIFKADKWDYVYESDKSNNIAVVPITFTLLPPDLTPLALQVPAEITGPPNPSLRVVWGIMNQGIGQAEAGYWPWSDRLYFSRNTTLDASDISLANSEEMGPVGAGQAYWRTNVVRVPAISDTNCYLILQTDSSDGVFESDESNNTLAVPLKVNVLSPDLTPIAFLAPNAVTSPPMPVLTFSWCVTNQGPGLAEGAGYWGWSDRLQISTNATLDETATFLNSWTETTSVPAGGSYWRTNTCTLPVRESGTYYLFFTTDSSQTVYESTFGNNTVGVPVTFTIQPADLAVLDLQSLPVISGPPKPKVTLAWGVTNQGVGSAVGNWSDWLLISSRPVLDYSATSLGWFGESGPVKPGSEYWRTNTLTLPITQSGQYYLFFQTDPANSLYESDTSNNQKSIPITVNILPPDLAPVALLVTNLVVGPPQPQVTFVWGVTNRGAGAAVGDWSWQDTLSLCPDPQASGNCSPFGSFYEGGIVEAGGVYWRTNTLRVPVTKSGVYFVRFDTDVSGSLLESSFTNNSLAVPVTFQIQPPDLAPITFQAPKVVTGAAYPRIKLSWGVTNQGVGPAIGYGNWGDAIYFSRSPVLDNDARQLVWLWENGPVTPGANYWRSQSVSLPARESGNYFLIFTVDASRALYDVDYTNNTLVVPITLNISLPDLTPIAFEAPTKISGSALTNVTLVWGVTNQGTGPAPASSWCDFVYLSATPQGSWSDPVVSSACDFDSVPPGGSYWRTNTVMVPATTNALLYFLFRTDGNNSLLESDAGNNTVVRPVTIEAELPDLAPLALQVPQPLIGPPSPIVNLIYGVTNRNACVVFGQVYPYDKVYLSKTNVLDGSETPLIWISGDSTILPGSTYWRTNALRLPITESGTYYVILQVDGSNSVSESNESNNVAVVPITFSLQRSDVAAVGLQGPSNLAGAPFPRVRLSWAATNLGPGVVQGQWNWWQAVYVSTNSILDSSARYALSLQQTNDLPPGGIQWFTNEVYLPIDSDGLYYVFVSVNPDNVLGETNTSNDVAVLPLNYSRVLPDLVPLNVQASIGSTTPPYPWITVTWGVTNQGAGTASLPQSWYNSVSWSDYLWLSGSSNVDASAIYLTSTHDCFEVGPGESYRRTNEVRLPIDKSGTYYLIFVTDSDHLLMESDFSNNTVVVPIQITTITPPDLMPIVFEAPNRVTGRPNPEVSVVWGVTNRGSGAAIPPSVSQPYYSWPLADGVYLSATPELDSPWWSTEIAGLWPRSTPILAGESYRVTNTIHVPINNSGTYYLIFRTDTFQTVAESDESNNQIALPVSFNLSPPADLTVLSFIAPRTVSGPGNPEVTFAWHVLNQGLGAAGGGWWDSLTLGGPSIYGGPVGSFWVTQELPPGTDYWQTNTVVLPVTESGQYQLTFQTGSGFGFFDLDPQDNQITVPLTVQITGPPTVRLANPQKLSGGPFQLSAYGAINALYTLEASTDLTHWSRVLDFVCRQDPTTLYDPFAGQFTRRFYRIAPFISSPPLQLSIYPQIPGGWMALMCDGPVNQLIHVQGSSDLVNWEEVMSVVPDMTPLWLPDPSSTNYSYRFYRAVTGN